MVEKDLLEGLLTISKYQYPNAKLGFVEDFFEQVRKDIWLELNDELTALEKLKVIKTSCVGVLSDEENASSKERQLKLSHFERLFMIWGCILIVATFSFLMEISFRPK